MSERAEQSGDWAERLMRRLRPVHIWWVGVLFFGPSVLLWAVAIAMVGLRVPFEWWAVRSIYLPLFAAVIGLAVPVIALSRCRRMRARTTGVLFGLYVVGMITWGVIDIRQWCYQVGQCGQTCWHIYYTWYFLPEGWIERIGR